MKLLSQFQLDNFLVEIERGVSQDQLTGHFTSTLYAQKANLPAMSIPSIQLANKLMRYSTVSNSDSISYSTFNVSFILDEDLEQYFYFYNWKESLILNPETFTKIRLYITTNKKNIKYVVTFIGVHLTEIGGVDFDSTMTEHNPVTFDVSFEYEYYVLERVANSETFISR